MIQEFYNNHVFLYVMGGLCVLGVLIQLLLLVIYNKLIAASENMTNPKKNWLKNMKLRFESSYHLQLGVNDVDTYVDKYVSKIKCGGLLLSTWENLSGQMIGLCLMTGSFAGVLGIVYQCGQDIVLFTFFAGAWGAIIVNIVDNIVNISAHRQMLRFNLIDYFENNLKVRMEQEIFHPQEREQYEQEYFKMETTSIRKGGDSGAQERRKKRQLSIDNQNDENKSVNKKTRKQERRQEKELLKEQRHLEKLQEKESKEKKRQDRLDAIQAKKQEKYDEKVKRKEEKEKRKQEVIEAQMEKRRKRQEIRDAKEDAEIEAIKSRRMEEEDLRIDFKGRTAKSKPQVISRAYQEKMRLKEEKEREAKKRELYRKSEAERKGRIEEDDEDDAFSDKQDFVEMTAISKEEDMLIEEVLKDFLL